VFGGYESACTTSIVNVLIWRLDNDDLTTCRVHCNLI